MLSRALKLRLSARTPYRSIARGQTMAEYALIVVAIAIVVLVAYEVMGQELSAAVTVVNTTILSAPAH
jgi:Flp pilus assembly pilin Flp